MNSVKSAKVVKIQNSLVAVNKQVNNFVKFLDVAPLAVRSYISGLKQFFLIFELMK